MPVYDYTCAECGHFETVRRIAERDEPAPCPQCGNEAARVVIGAPSLCGGTAQASEETGSYGMRHRGCSCC